MSASSVDVALRRVHRSVLAGIGLCALLAATSGASTEGDVTSPAYTPITLTAVALAAGAVLARRAATAPGAPARRRVTLTLASLLLAGGVGLSGVAAALIAGDRRAGLLYALGGAILILRPPPALAVPPDPD